MNDEVDDAQQPGMRLTLFHRDNALWCREETFYSPWMLLMDEFFRVSRECYERRLPMPEPPKDDRSQDRTVIAYRVSENYVRPLVPTEIALQSQNQAISDA
jgi:hypothetical protein